jgi:hypothetical protein
MLKPALIISFIALLFFSCSDLPCMKSYQLHLKANMAQSPAEKEYYEKQAEIYDQQCAKYNTEEYVKRQEEQSRKHR